ncbi:unnamed protein product [Rotaria sp. Silwood1]|nr:unnamed protein product [Rotaria sp. Silwood1]
MVDTVTTTMGNDNDDWEVAVDTGEFDKRLEQQEQDRAVKQACRNIGRVADRSSSAFLSSYDSGINGCTFSNYVSSIQQYFQDETSTNILIHENISKPLTYIELVDGTKKVVCLFLQ